MSEIGSAFLAVVRLACHPLSPAEAGFPPPSPLRPLQPHAFLLVTCLSAPEGLQRTAGGCKLLVWMQDRYPLTVAQLRKTKEDLAAMQERAEEISRLMTAGYGAADPKAIRAGELNSAIQRLQWELERSAGNSADATTA